MPVLAENWIPWLGLALVLILSGGLGMAYLGHQATEAAAAPGGSGEQSGSDILQVTIILAVGLACLFGATFILTS